MHAKVLAALLAAVMGRAPAAAPKADAPALPTTQPTEIVLGDKTFRVTVHVAGAELLTAFGPRFDNTAFVPSVKVQGKEYLGPYGLSGEFGINGTGVLGYEQAEGGGQFLKIGVGRLKRPDDKPYQFFRKYPIVELYRTKADRAGNVLTLTQQAALGNYALTYVKRYTVDPKARTVAIEYKLTNTGKTAWAVEHYNHNWFRFADYPVAPPYYVQPAFEVVAEKPKGMEIVAGRVRLTQLAKGAYTASDKPAAAEKNRLLVGRDKTDQSVRVTNDFPLARCAFYADARGLCPETFFRAELKPGKAAAWKRTYEFLLAS